MISNSICLRKAILIVFAFPVLLAAGCGRENSRSEKTVDQKALITGFENPARFYKTLDILVLGKR